MDPQLANARRKLREELEQRCAGDPRFADARVLDAIEQVPREEFVPDSVRHQAYANTALPIGRGQTISQPLMVAVMTQELELTGTERVLEVGTGSAYQAAILSLLAREVVTLERHAELAETARERLQRLGYTNVEVHVADGTLGWPDRAPYDAILVTAGAPDVPSPLYNQLRMGGRLVIPVGDEYQQDLKVVVKTDAGPDIHDAGGCRFVRLVGEAGWHTDTESPSV